MSKAQIAICLEMENIELLSEIRTKYRLKNLSKAVELLIRQWQMFLEDKQRQKLAEKEKNKPVNSFVNP
jgi:hypothetical protein